VKESGNKFAGRIEALSQAQTLSFVKKPPLRQALSAYHVDHAPCVLPDGAPIAVTPKQARRLNA
jgi:hypothetical protein